MIKVLLAATGLAVLAGWALTGTVRRYALARGILDRPNERSSHTVPTPLGGGWGISVPALAAAGVAWALGWLDARTTLGIAGGGLAVTLTGWLDDRFGLSAGVRLMVQVLAAAGMIAALGGVARLGLSGTVLAVLATVWSTNLYNFMDGIDGIAGTEAVWVLGVGGTLLWLGGAPGLALIALATAGASAGFLVWNRPPARIFMGDAGSGLLGFLIAALALAGERSGAVPALIWVLLLGAFLADATIVLVRRVRRGERWYAAHRTHLYQRLVQAGWSHGQVDGALLVLNAGLAPLAVQAWRSPVLIGPLLAAGVVLVGIAYVAGERSLASGDSRKRKP